MLAAFLDFVWEAAKVIGWITLTLVILIGVFGTCGGVTEED